MPSASKNKGSTWEREVAKFLSQLYGEHFMRSPGSGAYVGGVNQSRREFLHEGQIRSFKGDIVPGQSFPRFNAEAKSYKDFPFHQLFGDRVGVLEQWIEQCVAVCDPGDFNILFMKFNRKGSYVAVQADPASTELALDRYFHYKSKNYGSWIIMDFGHFFELNKEVVRRLCSAES